MIFVYMSHPFSLIAKSFKSFGGHSSETEPSAGQPGGRPAHFGGPAKLVF
jgi:hypothetical protein